jgi:hypothetical protein
MHDLRRPRQTGTETRFFALFQLLLLHRKHFSASHFSAIPKMRHSAPLIDPQEHELLYAAEHESRSDGIYTLPPKEGCKPFIRDNRYP